MYKFSAYYEITKLRDHSVLNKIYTCIALFVISTFLISCGQSEISKPQNASSIKDVVKLEKAPKNQIQLLEYKEVQFPQLVQIALERHPEAKPYVDENGKFSLDNVEVTLDHFLWEGEYNLEITLLKKSFPIVQAFEQNKNLPKSKLLSMTTKKGYNFLHLAINANDPYLTKQFLDLGFYIEEKTPSNNTPLHLAVVTDAYRVVPVLLEQGANRKAQGGGRLKRSPMRRAYDLDHWQVYKAFVDNSPTAFELDWVKNKLRHRSAGRTFKGWYKSSLKMGYTPPTRKSDPIEFGRYVASLAEGGKIKALKGIFNSKNINQPIGVFPSNPPLNYFVGGDWQKQDTFGISCSNSAGTGENDNTELIEWALKIGADPSWSFYFPGDGGIIAESTDTVFTNSCSWRSAKILIANGVDPFLEANLKHVDGMNWWDNLVDHAKNTNCTKTKSKNICRTLLAVANGSIGSIILGDNLLGLSEIETAAYFSSRIGKYNHLISIAKKNSIFSTEGLCWIADEPTLNDNNEDYVTKTLKALQQSGLKYKMGENCYSFNIVKNGWVGAMNILHQENLLLSKYSGELFLAAETEEAANFLFSTNISSKGINTTKGLVKYTVWRNVCDNNWSTKTVRRLLDKGADPNLDAKIYGTPLEMMSQRCENDEKEEIITLLKEYGGR